MKFQTKLFRERFYTLSSCAEEKEVVFCMKKDVDDDVVVVVLCCGAVCRKGGCVLHEKGC